MSYHYEDIDASQLHTNATESVRYHTAFKGRGNSGSAVMLSMAQT